MNTEIGKIQFSYPNPGDFLIKTKNRPTSDGSFSASFWFQRKFRHVSKSSRPNSFISGEFFPTRPHYHTKNLATIHNNVFYTNFSCFPFEIQFSNRKQARKKFKTVQKIFLDFFCLRICLYFALRKQRPQGCFSADIRARKLKKCQSRKFFWRGIHM